MSAEDEKNLPKRANFVSSESFGARACFSVSERFSHRARKRYCLTFHV
jgi:hypothetical protein